MPSVWPLDGSIHQRRGKGRAATGELHSGERGRILERCRRDGSREFPNSLGMVAWISKASPLLPKCDGRLHTGIDRKAEELTPCLAWVRGSFSPSSDTHHRAVGLSSGSAGLQSNRKHPGCNSWGPCLWATALSLSMGNSEAVPPSTCAGSPTWRKKKR